MGNTSTLPLVGQLLSKQGKSAPVWQTAACVIVAEVVMVIVAWFIGKERGGSVGPQADLSDRVRCTGAAQRRHGFQPCEGHLIGLQALDGVAAGIYGVLLTLVTADLARGTGRLNFLQGSVQSATGPRRLPQQHGFRLGGARLEL